MPNLLTVLGAQATAMVSAKHIIFDVDNTVTQNLEPISTTMSSLISDLSKRLNKHLYFMSGTGVNELKKMVSKKLSNIPHVLCGGSGTHICMVDGKYSKELYLDKLTLKEKKRIRHYLNNVISEFNLPSDVSHQILDRKSQITFSCMGRYANPDLKNKFDPGGELRKEMIVLLQDYLPEFSIKVGGTTSIDITRGEFDKSTGIKKLNSLFDKLEYKNTLFIGDSFFEGGNDRPALDLVDCIEVTGPENLEEILTELLK